MNDNPDLCPFVPGTVCEPGACDNWADTPEDAAEPTAQRCPFAAHSWPEDDPRAVIEPVDCAPGDITEPF